MRILILYDNAQSAYNRKDVQQHTNGKPIAAGTIAE